jgi:hypothetical protein
MIWDKIKEIYKIYPQLEDADFFVEKDKFENVQIDSCAINGFWYFKNSKKGLIKRFILQETDQTQKICVVTLIKKENGKFTPRFDFQIWNITKKAFENLPKDGIDQNLIKAKVSFDSCYENFILLIDFIKRIEEVDFGSISYVVIDKSKKDIFENITKDVAIENFKNKYGKDISEKDISLLQDRRSKLEYFNNLLISISFFNNEKLKLGKNKRDEDVWQDFFEKNPWVFGYGLQLIACEGLDDKKLEQTVVGNDIINGSGKRIDALLKTRGSISKILFCEIKTHFSDLLIEPYKRPGVFVPAKELRGAVAQVQKTIHKATLKLQENFHKLTKKNGDPTGEEILFVRPRGIVVIGRLDDFKKENGINYEKLSSFELYRQQINGIEIITYDELYERVKFIVEN